MQQTQDTGSVPGSRRSPGVRNGNPLEYACLENFMNRRDWQATVHGRKESDTTEQLNIHTAAAKSLHSCPTLCDPLDGSPPGKNTGVGCHFLLQCMKVKGESEVAQSCPTLSDPMDCSLPGSSIHGIFQARVLEWGAIAFSGAYTHARIYSSPKETMMAQEEKIHYQYVIVFQKY